MKINHNQWAVIIVIAAVVAALLTGCEARGVDVTEKYTVMPDGLKDCHVFTIRAKNESDLYIVRCPLAETSATWTVRHGKSTSTYHTALVNYAY